MIQTKHTPTPWEYVTKKDRFGSEKLISGQPDSDGMRPVICGCIMNPSDAAYIVKCVNSHAELVEALGLVMKNSTNFRLKGPDYLIEKVEAALAKAGAE
jgi:hypothetical protein